MTVTLMNDRSFEQDVEAAFNIALGFLRATGQAGDEQRTSEFVAASIARRLRKGERHRILLANHAIGDYQARFLVEHAVGS
jgi:hypothetical protein